MGIQTCAHGVQFSRHCRDCVKERQDPTQALSKLLTDWAGTPRPSMLVLIENSYELGRSHQRQEEATMRDQSPVPCLACAKAN